MKRNRDLDLSIHPRNWPGADRPARKSNTCKAKSPAVTVRKIASMERHLARHPDDKATVSHLAILKG